MKVEWTDFNHHQSRAANMSHVHVSRLNVPFSSSCSPTREAAPASFGGFAGLGDDQAHKQQNIKRQQQDEYRI